MKLSNIINECINELNETTYKVYHGTNEKFSRFNLNKTAQGIIWFTDSIDSIKSGDHGGNGSKYIMTRYITINKPAGWDEYEKYGLQELEDMGYDGVILPQGDKTDYFVFSTKSISSRINEEDSHDDSVKIGVNINDDTHPFTEEILSGRKTIETRNKPTLRPYVGKRIGIIKTGKNIQASLVGYVTIGSEIVYNNADSFNADSNKHLVVADSPFYIKGIKYGYTLINPVAIEPKPIKSRGIVSRKINEDEYRGEHLAPSKQDAPLYDLTQNFPEDIYSKDGLRYYGNNEPYDNFSMAVIRSARNRPNAQIAIYRAVPKVLTNREKIAEYQKHQAYIMKYGKLPPNVDNWKNRSEYYEFLNGEIDRLSKLPEEETKMKINSGDWVTINLQYAKSHGYSHLNNKYRILKKIVPAKDLYWDGGDINEWGYNI